MSKHPQICRLKPQFHPRIVLENEPKGAPMVAQHTPKTLSTTSLVMEPRALKCALRMIGRNLALNGEWTRFCFPILH